MVNALFSTYKQGENRITSSTLAVFERLEGYVLQDLLAALLSDAQLTLIEYSNQITSGIKMRVPDAQIKADIHYLFEFKMTPNAVNLEQLKGHLKHFVKKSGDQRLIVITPDAEAPPQIAMLKGKPVFWSNFRNFAQVITSLIESDAVHISERSVFLLKELIRLFDENNLIDKKEVLIVAARVAFPNYKKFGSYVCQPGRKFKNDITHMGFYCQKSIQLEIPKIRSQRDNVRFDYSEVTRLEKTRSPEDAEFARTIKAYLDKKEADPGSIRKVILLTSAEEPATLKLKQLITNNLRDKNDEIVAWTMGNRYTSKASLFNTPAPKTTTELDELDKQK